MPAMALRMLPGLLLVTCASMLVLPLSAHGSDDREARRTVRCSAGSEATLRLRSDDGRIRVELEIESERRRSTWTVILLHERRTVLRNVLRADGGGTVRVRRSVPDWVGTDSFAARATGPRAESCRLSAAL